MIIRIEFGEHRSPKFPWLLRICRKFPTYKAFVEEGMTIYSIEFTEKELDQFRAIHNILYGLPRVAYYLDGRMLPKEELFSEVRRIKKDQHWDKWIEKMTRNQRTQALFHPKPNDEMLRLMKKHGLFGNKN